jgi:hypothetical protein
MFKAPAFIAKRATICSFGALVVTDDAVATVLRPELPEDVSTGLPESTPLYRVIPPAALVWGVIVHVYEVGSEAPAIFRYDAIPISVPLSERLISVHPEGAEMLARLPPLTETLARRKSPSAVEDGFAKVRAVMVMLEDVLVVKDTEIISETATEAVNKVITTATETNVTDVCVNFPKRCFIYGYETILDWNCHALLASMFRLRRTSLSPALSIRDERSLKS